MSEKRDERLEELIQEPQAVESETEKEPQTQTDEHKPEKKNSALREVLSWCMTFVIAIAKRFPEKCNSLTVSEKRGETMRKR